MIPRPGYNRACYSGTPLGILRLIPALRESHNVSPVGIFQGKYIWNVFCFSHYNDYNDNSST